MMNGILKRAAAGVLTAAMVLSLAACGGGVTAFDATKYIQGTLDENYLGKFDPDFLELVDSTEKEAEEIYLGNLEAESSYFASAFAIDYMEGDILDETMELYKEIYAKAKYTVDPATKIDDKTFGVKVTVEPIDVLHLVYDAMAGDEVPADVQAFYDKYADVDVENMSDEDYIVYDNEWARLMIALTREKLADSGYLEAKSTVVQVAQGDDDVWSIPDDDFMTVDSYIVDYNF